LVLQTWKRVFCGVVCLRRFCGQEHRTGNFIPNGWIRISQGMSKSFSQLENGTEFLRMVALVLRQSGGLLEVTSLAKHTGASRPTVMNWLDVLQITQVARMVRPFSGGGRREIIAQPKLYAFDTGFVCHARGGTV
jgi:hypothetical protein